ncbi:MAG: type II toxin-antitoxin system death-on-curing family toxin [Phycisphaerae bacterium]|jgi:death-on-curing family protein
MKNITLKDIQYIAFTLARQIMSYDEPIPDYSTRFPGVLESCVATPFMKFEGKYLYKTFIDKAAILFYLMIKNHPFQNGNKRIVVTTLLCFLGKNGRWINVDAKNLYNLTVWIAQSPADVKGDVIAAVKSYIEKYYVKAKD